MEKRGEYKNIVLGGSAGASGEDEDLLTHPEIDDFSGGFHVQNGRHLREASKALSNLEEKKQESEKRNGPTNNEDGERLPMRGGKQMTSEV